MDVIMSECNFTSLTYSPDSDSVVNNVRVKATRPSTLSGSNAAVAAGAATARSTSLGLAISLVGFVLGAAVWL